MIPQLIFDRAKKAADSTAVIHNGRPWSYGSFAQLIALARGYFTRRACVGPGYAAIAVRNQFDFWVLSLALRSLGLTTIAVPDVPAVGKLGLPNVRCVITTAYETWAGLESLCAERGLPLLSVSRDGESATALQLFDSSYPTGGHILRTSGTTGSHKLVLFSPACDADFIQRKVELLGLKQDCVYCLFGFGVGTGIGYKCAASAWSVGGAVVIEEGRDSLRALLRPGVTHAVLTPLMLDSILDAPADAFPRNDTIQLAVGGGAIGQALVDRATARITHRLFNWLASTEAGTVALTPLASPGDHIWHRLMPGRLIEIVDDSDRPVPIGAIGRVRVSTEGGPTSYLHDEAATRAFFKDGFFYPGDLAVMRADGRMALQGRVTDVINVGGEKFLPAPIEERLGELFGVSGVCLFSAPNDSGEEEIHVVVETPTPIEPERLNAAINQELRGFHRAHVHYVAALPRNEMGKVLRQEIRAKVTAG
jgi:acyl-CoA synthetase (AMP-forming)/AMP-acid ligase II